MRIRKLDANDDRIWGHSQADYLVNDPVGVGQLVKSRCGLWLGQWYLAVSDGMPWLTRVVGKGTEATRDPALRTRILGTDGVNGILAYSSSLDRDTRIWTAQADVSTIYGRASVTLQGPR